MRNYKLPICAFVAILPSPDWVFENVGFKIKGLKANLYFGQLSLDLGLKESIISAHN